MTINIYNLIILVGAIHGLLLSVLLFFNKPIKSTNTLLALILIYYLSPLYLKVNQYLIASPSNQYDLLWSIQQFGGIFSILLYLSLSIKMLMNYSRWVKDNYSDIHKKNLNWIQKPIILYSLFFLLWFAQRVYDIIFYADSLPLKHYYPLLMLLLLTTYWIGTKGYLRK